MVQIAAGQAAEAVATDDATAQAVARAATTLELLDFEVIAYNSFGGTVTPPDDADWFAVIPTADGKSFMMHLAGVAAPTAGDLLLLLI